MSVSDSSSESSEAPAADGRVADPVGPYSRTECLLSDGGTTVYRARDRTGRKVLLKVVDPRRSVPSDLARLHREFEVASSLEGCPVVRPLRFEAQEGAPAVVFEDTGGEPLDRIFALPLPVERFLELSVRIAGAVADLHRAGVVHKDLKPQNVLVHPVTLDVTLLGLGLATRLPRERQPARPPHLVEGSLPYMSPEQTGRTNSLLDSRTDLYSLGATFYQLLTGRLLCDASDPLEWLHFHTAQVPVPPTQLVPHLPDMISQVVLRLLAKAAEDRYQTARGLERDLRRCRAQWQDEGMITPFVLRQHDVPDRLQFPHKLYGRDPESAVLRAALDRVTRTGVCELVVISGYSGVGKSMLAGQLESPTLSRGGHFVTGKADPHRREVPYSTLAEAFGDLVLTVIAEEEERAAARTHKVQVSLGIDGPLVATVVPQVELLAGK